MGAGTASSQRAQLWEAEGIFCGSGRRLWEDLVGGGGTSLEDGRAPLLRLHPDQKTLQHPKLWRDPSHHLHIMTPTENYLSR